MKILAIRPTTFAMLVIFTFTVFGLLDKGWQYYKIGSGQ